MSQPVVIGPNPYIAKCSGRNMVHVFELFVCLYANSSSGHHRVDHIYRSRVDIYKLKASPSRSVHFHSTYGCAVLERSQLPPEEKRARGVCGKCVVWMMMMGEWSEWIYTDTHTYKVHFLFSHLHPFVVVSFRSLAFVHFILCMRALWNIYSIFTLELFCVWRCGVVVMLRELCQFSMCKRAAQIYMRANVCLCVMRLFYIRREQESALWFWRTCANGPELFVCVCVYMFLLSLKVFVFGFGRLVTKGALLCMYVYIVYILHIMLLNILIL